MGSSRLTSGRLLQRPSPQWGFNSGNKLIFGAGTRLSVQPSKESGARVGTDNWFFFVQDAELMPGVFFCRIPNSYFHPSQKICSSCTQCSGNILGLELKESRGRWRANSPGPFTRGSKILLLWAGGVCSTEFLVYRNHNLQPRALQQDGAGGKGLRDKVSTQKSGRSTSKECDPPVSCETSVLLPSK